ncbi:MAG: Glutaredoxin-like domain protein [Acetothermia bacterium 64_32]|nr:MAG: Glutaredoxin-like domain protein [Acetothermia bacterium 64_32]
MPYIQEEDRRYLEDQFAKLGRDVTLRLFVRREGCPTCEVEEDLLSELAGISPRLHLLVHDLDAEPALGEEWGVDKVPALAIEADRDYGIRFYGIPSGYEFASLIEDILDVGAGEVDLPEEVSQGLEGLDRDVHIQVFVTPTCPYCPVAVRTAHKFAMLSERVRADMVMANEFPILTDHYQVMAVPKVVINETTSFEGAVPEEVFLDRVLRG